jgi:hypothetical protein
VAAKLEQGLTVANAALAQHSSSSSSSGNDHDDDTAAAAAASELPDTSSQPNATDTTAAAAGDTSAAAAAGSNSSAAAAAASVDKNYYGANGVPAMPAFARDINVVLGVPHRVWGKDITGNTLMSSCIQCK